jgi:hypothetical protein
LNNASLRALVVTLGLCGTVLPCPAVAQNPPAPAPPASRRELVGVVRDPGGVPVEGARVDIPGTSALSNDKGMFQLWTGNIDTVTISIHRLGFAAIEALITARNRQWDTVVVELDPTAQRVTGVTVKVAAGTRQRWMEEFEQRKSRGLGVFVTREQIAARNTTRLSDVLRDRRGINVVRLGTGRYGVRFSTHSGSIRGTACQPDVWIDGVRARGMEVDDIFASTVEAVELYDTFSTVPMQFSQETNSVPCGTVVIWTRVPGRAERDTIRPDA